MVTIMYNNANSSERKGTFIDRAGFTPLRVSSHTCSFRHRDYFHRKNKSTNLKLVNLRSFVVLNSCYLKSDNFLMDMLPQLFNYYPQESTEEKAKSLELVASSQVSNLLV